MSADKPRVAVLGAGIMGSCAALLLARSGCAVTLIDQAHEPMCGASRWNEGKIHLGFLYAADPSGRTAEKLIPGGLAFRRLIEQMIAGSIEPAISVDEDIYLLHPDSVVEPAEMERYVRTLDDRLAGQGGYLAPLRRVAPLGRAELDKLSSGVKTGFRVPERSVNTLWIADRMVDAIKAEPRICFRGSVSVSAVEPIKGNWDGPWRLACGPVIDGTFDIVINALWEGRLRVDKRAGITPQGKWSHRYRLALFIETRHAIDLPNAVLATGPFGDVKNYDRRHFYLSWYPAGLIASGQDVEPPEIARVSNEKVIRETITGLSHFVPGIAEVMKAAATIQVEGGWVFAAGTGPLSDAKSTLHRRDQFGVLRRGTYYSVDTGKYSTAPWLARRIADEILDL